MRITLFTEDKICEFFLPTQVSGSYNFDEDQNEETKLINIEARNNTWTLCSHEDVDIIDENNKINEVSLVPNNFYILRRNGINYLLFVTATFEDDLSIYSYDKNVNLVIGNSTECNLMYSNCPYFKGVPIRISYQDNVFKATIDCNTMVFKNNERIKESEINLKPGDVLNLFGLKMLFLSSLLIINHPTKGIVINEQASLLKTFNYVPEKYANKEVKDIDLYDKKDYFSKSPRIRRIIEEKEIKIDAPPKSNEKEEMPLMLTIGPMLTMASMSCMTMLNTLMNISRGESSWKQSWAQVAMSVVMLSSSLMWPLITKYYNKHSERNKRRKIVDLYQSYLENKEAELKKELILQKNIIEETLISSIDCLKIINTRKNNFWCKRSEQNDFLSVRVGIGNVPLKVKINWPEEGFTIEEDYLKKMADELIKKYEYIEQCPLEYSFYNNFLTAIMGMEQKCYSFMNNMLLQLMTFYCYDELKIVLFTSEEKAQNWDYLKYSNYTFTNNKNVRFFAANIEEAKELGSYLLQELNYKIQLANGKELPNQKPHYLIICDNYNAYKKTEFFKVLTELDQQIGYSTVILENKLDRLPSKCINFINLADGMSGILKNSYEDAEITNFKDEIDYNINMMEITKILSNIPIEIEGAAAKLPESIEFLEMEKVGKVEQLNILNRWNTNDSTKSLKAEVGVDEEGNYIYLDLHEKFHGPHGLVAGTTGSGKSEFIITYILSMCINYSPDDVAFILIDYKGGGLAYAFENKTTGVKLPHLSGTITNLDKSEMNRTLVSIDSEVKRRQAEFNKARDLLGESTIDIYKYQQFYHEGKLEKPIPHLFIISDEFAELKSQQPDFMDNLISVARIGRSLGVHLILATQKPSGVVNDQIWSNTKFRVCLKVADAGDSNEMLKKPDAALLKQSGRFYLQVGMDEIYELGQSGWAGAKYFPSEKIVKQVDKSINFIDNGGQVIKTIQESNNQAKKEAQGEQLAAIMKEIINVSKQADKHAKKLWLDNIPKLILVDDVEKKYNTIHTPYNVTATIGEFDAPELQVQGIVSYNLLEHGNTGIYGTDGAEREKMLNSIIYSICKFHTVDEVNIYAIDYGSESLRIFEPLPHFGGIVYAGETEKYTNLVKMLDEEKSKRKKLFVDYGGSYVNYIKNSGKKLPLKFVIINNIDTAKENVQGIMDDFTYLFRDSERYGIVHIITGNGDTSTTSRMKQSINNNYALKLKDRYEYSDVLGGKSPSVPADTEGRGMLNNDGIHEFQTASIVADEANFSQHILAFIEEVKANNPTKSQKIPTLPENVRIEDIQDEAQGLKSVPMGIIRKNLDVLKINLLENIGFVIGSNKIQNAEKFIKSLLRLFKSMKTSVILIDGLKTLSNEKTNVANYFDSNFDEVITKINNFVDDRMNKENTSDVVIVLHGLDKFKAKVENFKAFEELLNKLKKHEKIPFIIADDGNNLKAFQFETWFKILLSAGEGIWVGTGVNDQTILKTSGFEKEYTLQYPNNMGFYVSQGIGTLCKLLDFITQDEEEGDKNEQ